MIVVFPGHTHLLFCMSEQAGRSLFCLLEVSLVALVISIKSHELANFTHDIGPDKDSLCT